MFSSFLRKSACLKRKVQSAAVYCKVSVDDVIVLQLHILQEHSSYIWFVYFLTVNKYNLYCLHILTYYLQFPVCYESLGITIPLIYVQVCALVTVMFPKAFFLLPESSVRQCKSVVVSSNKLQIKVSRIIVFTTFCCCVKIN